MVLTTPIERARGTIRSAWSNRRKAADKAVRSAWSDRDKTVARARSTAIEPVRSSKAVAIAVGGAALAGVAGLYILAKRSFSGKAAQPSQEAESELHEPAQKPGSAGNGRPQESEAAKATAK